MEIPFLGSSYEGRSGSINAQRSINIFPVYDKGEGKVPIAMYGTPGTDDFCDTGTSAIVRRMHIMGDYLYAVVGNTVYEIDSDGSATSLGTITTSTGHVGMADNGIQLLIVDGTTSGYIVTEGAMANIDDGITWTIRESPADNNWTDLAYGNGVYVAVASSGTGNRVMTSTTGGVITIRVSAEDNDWTSVAYGGGVFVAVANTGTGNRVMTSPDGITWTIGVSAADNDWESVTYGNGLFVAVASSGTGDRVMTSEDGETWTIRVSAADNDWMSVTYGNNLYVAVSETGTGTRVMTSPDGIVWTIRESAADNKWTSVTYGNSLYVAVSDTGTSNRVMTSSNGIIWTSRTSAIDNDWQSVTYSDVYFIAVSNTGTGNRTMISEDGITWEAGTSAADNDWTSIIFETGLVYAAVASSGTGNRIMTSPEGNFEFPAATDCIFFDGYFIITILNTGRIQISNLYDGYAWDPLDYATAEASPDVLVGIGTTRQNIWLFGGDSTEVYYNAGNADFPFQIVPGAILDIGCESLTSVTEIEGVLYWLTNKKTVVKNNGYSFETVSTPAIDYQISTYTTTNDSIGYTYTLEGRTFYVLNFPSEDKTWVLNIKDGQWHEWQSKV